MNKPIRIHQPRQSPARMGPLPTRETILLVDDEQVMREFLRKCLLEDGYQVLSAANGEEALSLSEQYEGIIHLLITDVMMPVMNGKELADRLCALRPDIKVLFISGFGRRDIWPVDACEDQTDWLPKPFTSPIFNAKVREILQSVS